MNRSIRTIALSAIVSLSAFAAQAQVQGEGPGVSGIPAPARSQALAPYVMAEVARPQHMAEGSAHVVAPLQSGLSRDAVKAQALMAARAGGAMQGEIPAM